MAKKHKKGVSRPFCSLDLAKRGWTSRPLSACDIAYRGISDYYRGAIIRVSLRETGGRVFVIAPNNVRHNTKELCFLDYHNQCRILTPQRTELTAQLTVKRRD